MTRNKAIENFKRMREEDLAKGGYNISSEYVMIPLIDYDMAESGYLTTGPIINDINAWDWPRARWNRDKRDYDQLILEDEIIEIKDGEPAN